MIQLKIPRIDIENPNKTSQESRINFENQENSSLENRIWAPTSTYTAMANHFTILQIQNQGIDSDVAEIEQDANYSTEQSEENMQLREEIARLQELATIDSLTNIGNRRYFDEEINAQIGDTRRKGTQAETLSVIMIDIDHFKNYNDENGHDEGDRVLQLVASTLKEESRGLTRVSRYGGEEFVVTMPNTNPVDAYIAAERYRSAIEAKGITISQGIANYHSHIEDKYEMEEGKPTFEKEVSSVAKELVKKADNALYMAKTLGRNGIVFANDHADLHTKNKEMKNQIIDSGISYLKQAS